MEKKVDFPGFRELLHVVESTDTLIRVRISGEGWMPFTRLILLSESAMILQAGHDRKVIVNLRNVAEFELDRPALDFSGSVIYTVGY